MDLVFAPSQIETWSLDRLRPYNHAHEELHDLVEHVTIELELINVAKELEP